MPVNFALGDSTLPMKTASRIWRALAWTAANAAIWLALVYAYYWLLTREVAEEYRLGYRTSTDGDSLGIPVFGFAISLGVLLLVANAIIFVVRVVRRRRSRPVT